MYNLKAEKRNFQPMEEKLIELIKNTPYLYNKDERNYKNFQLRDKKFNEFSKLLNVPAKKLKARWRTLKDKYVREMKNPSVKKWKWMDHLYFLRGIKTENANSPDNYDTILFVTDEDELEEEFDEPFSMKWEDTMEVPDDDCAGYSRKTSITNGKLSESISNEGHENNEGEILLKSSPTKFNSPPKSSIRIFCESIAKQIENANLSQYEETSLQIALLTTLREFMPQTK